MPVNTLFFSYRIAMLECINIWFIKFVKLKILFLDIMLCNVNKYIKFQNSVWLYFSVSKLYTKINVKNCYGDIVYKDKNLDGKKAFFN